MIHVNGEEFVLSWHGGRWRDKAGHPWTMDAEGNLFSTVHGRRSQHSYKVVPMEQEKE